MARHTAETQQQHADVPHSPTALHPTNAASTGARTSTGLTLLITLSNASSQMKCPFCDDVPECMQRRLEDAVEASPTIYYRWVSQTKRDNSASLESCAENQMLLFKSHQDGQQRSALLLAVKLLVQPQGLPQMQPEWQLCIQSMHTAMHCHR